MKKLNRLLLLFIILLLARSVILSSEKPSLRFGDPPTASYHRITLDSADVYHGDLLLINTDHPLKPEGKMNDIINLNTGAKRANYALPNSEIHLSQKVATKFDQMVADARSQGVDGFLIRSGYRDLDEQAKIHRKNDGLTAQPAGASEHNAGFALDVNSLVGPMASSRESQWLADNCWRYGFVMRYPDNKTDITGIKFEPWHIRYVGLPHSVIMKKRGFCLEEYIEYLREAQSASLTYQNQYYEVQYFPIKTTKSINIPANTQYDLSGNNIDGVILTTYSETARK